jgi:hypothetical protein
MSPDELLLRRLAREIEAELANIERLRFELRDAPSGDDTFSLRGRASVLHDFYTGVERIFIRIAEELDGGVPRGEQWHRQLLQDMSLELPEIRPAVISTETAERLGDYLRFRHVFRNVYGFVLDATRLKPLEENFNRAVDAFLTESRAFAGWLRGEG